MDLLPSRGVLFKSQGTSIIFTGRESQLFILQWVNLQTVLRLYMFLRTEFAWKKRLTNSNMEFSSQSAGIPNYILCADGGELVVKVGFWSAFKFFKKKLKKKKMK